MDDDGGQGDQPSLVSVQPPVADLSAKTLMTDPPGSNGDQAHVAVSNADVEAPQNVDDSSSDVSMVADSDDGHEGAAMSPLAQDATPSESPHDATAKPPGLALKKRKSPDERSSDSSDERNSAHGGQYKKVKLDSHHEEADYPGPGAYTDKSFLPAEIWHHVFTFCPPRSLGNLLTVNKLFHSYLHPSSSISSEYPKPLPITTAHVLKPGAIWQASRRLFWPNMPIPLQDKTELEMWQLACSLPCGRCGKVDGRPPPQILDPLRLGPGADGVSTIWPFATRLCGICLVRNSVKEMDLLLSPSTPASLIPALNFASSTPELNIIPSHTLERTQSANITTIKFFWLPEVETLRQELQSAQELGPSIVEEWLKGLDGRGIARRHDSARWEKFATSGGVGQMRSLLYPGYQPKPKRQISAAESGNNQPVNAVVTPVLASTANAAYAVTLSTLPVATGQMANGTISNGTGEPFRAVPQLRPERTKEEIAELKAARKKDIELRARMLDPPLLPNVLAHIPSFQAAIQIPKPLDDDAWELLKPRLLTQRGDAEQRERECLAQTRLKLEPDEERTPEDVFRERALVDEDWNEVQAPVRARIAGFADEIIRDGWDGGDNVTKEKTPKFAAEVLIYVRRRFYAEVAKDAAAARAAGEEPPSDPPQGPFTQKLTLENMKWIFDAKIKPYTEVHRKEIFSCNGQNCQGNTRFYGFEGVIQHYAAKHTNMLSSGSIVVHWRAEWPEVPPFHPEGRIGRNPIHHAGTPFHPPQYGAGVYDPGPPALPQPPPQYHGGMPAPYSASPYGEAYPPPPSVPFAPPGYPSNHPPFGPPHFQPQAAPYAAFPPVPSQGGPYPGPPAPPTQSYGVPPQATPAPHNGPPAPQGYGVPPQAIPAPHNGPPVPPGAYNYNYGAFQANGQAGYAAPPGGPYVDQYPAQLNDMARNARELWGSTVTMKDALGSARVHTIIYHLAKRFRHRFSEEPPLTMFIDGLSNNRDMRPVRNVNGLLCRACHLGLGNASSMEQDRKSFSLPQLVNHFQGKHIEPVLNTGQFGPPLDWTTDMVLLPDMATLSTLRGVIGGDQVKYHLVSEAIPDAFADPNQVAPHSAYQTHPPESAWQQKPEPVDNYARFYTSPHQGAPGGLQTLHQDTVEPYGQYPSGYSENVTHSGYGGPPDDPSRPRGVGIPSGSVPEPAFPSSSNTRFDSTGRKSAQGYQSNQEQNMQQTRQGTSRKKAGPRGRNNHGGQKRRGGSEEGEVTGDFKAARGRQNDVSEAETKKAEEEQRRQGEEIHAMWAADRAQTAKGPATSGGETNKPSKGLAKTAQSKAAIDQQAKSRTPQQFSRPKPPPVAPRQEPPRERERAPRPEPPREHALEPQEPNLLDVLEMHLDQGQLPSHPPQQYRDRQPRLQSSQEVYRDNRPGRPQREPNHKPHHEPLHEPQRELQHELQHELQREPPREPHREPHVGRVIYVNDRHEVAPRESEGYARFDDNHVDMSHSRSASPAYVRYAQQPPVEAYRERSPPPRHREPLYQSRPGPAPLEDVQYERVPPRQDEAQYERTAPPRQEYYRVYADEVIRPQPLPVEYEEYDEIVEVRGPEGSYLVRQPVRRVREPQRELPQSQEPARYFAQPPAYEDAHRRYDDDRHHFEDEHAARPARSYEPQQRQQPVYPREAGPPPQQQQRAPLAYPREQPQYQREPSAYPREAGPSPSDGRMYARAEPGAPPPQHQHQAQAVSRSDPAYFEEYDPRFPAAAPPAGARAVRY